MTVDCQDSGQPSFDWAISHSSLTHANCGRPAVPLSNFALGSHLLERSPYSLACRAVVTLIAASLFNRYSYHFMQATMEMIIGPRMKRRIRLKYSMTRKDD